MNDLGVRNRGSKFSIERTEKLILRFDEVWTYAV